MTSPAVGAPLTHRFLPGRRRDRQPTDDGFNRKLLAPLVTGAILNPVNSTIIAVALVPIGLAFGAPPSATAWLISGLYLATSVGQPVVGRLVDLYGPRRLFLPATALVGLAGIIGTVAPNLGVLVLARVILGFGTCAGYPAAMRLIRNEADRTGQDSPAFVLTILAISTQTISVIGPTLGGLLIGAGGWRTTFAINIPLAVFAFVLGARRFRKEPARAATDGAGGADDAGGQDGQDGQDGAEAVGGWRGLDLLGMVFFAGTLVALLLFLMNPHLADWYLLVIAIAAGTLFTMRERRHRDPFINLRVLSGNRPLVLTYIRALLAYIVSYSFIYGYTQWLEDGRGLSPSDAGLLTLPLFATGIAVSALTGRRKELRGKLVVAAAGQLLACALLLTVHASSAIWLLVVITLVLGIPQGLNSLGLQNSVYRQADPQTIGASAGLLRTFGYLGAIISSAAQAGFYGQRADTTGLHHLALLLIGVAAAFLLITVFDRSLRSRQDEKTSSSSVPEETRTRA